LSLEANPKINRISRGLEKIQIFCDPLRIAVMPVRILLEVMDTPDPKKTASLNARIFAAKPTNSAPLISCHEYSMAQNSIRKWSYPIAS